MLHDPSFDVVFDDVILGDNHALFDLTRIAQVLTELIVTIPFVKQPQDLSRRRRRQSSHNSTEEASNNAVLNAKKPRFDPAQLETDGVQPTPLVSLPNLNSTSLGPPPPLRALWPPPTSPSSQLAYHQGKPWQ